MLEGFAEQGTGEGCIGERQCRTLDIAAADIEADLLNEIADATGIGVHADDRIAGQLQ
jgi:hypothetical protein